MADLSFEWFGFDQTSKFVSNSPLTKQLNRNKTKGGQMWSDTLPYEVSESSLVLTIKCVTPT